MKTNIFKELIAKSFTSLGTNQINHRDIIKAFDRKESGHYIEIYKESWGFSVIIYGKGFMNGYFPFRFDITNLKDVKDLRKKLNQTLA